jgi:hypothetical protein
MQRTRCSVSALAHPRRNLPCRHRSMRRSIGFACITLASDRLPIGRGRPTVYVEM